jgi:hypothetical protein
MKPETSDQRGSYYNFATTTSTFDLNLGMLPAGIFCTDSLWRGRMFTPNDINIFYQLTRRVILDGI